MAVVTFEVGKLYRLRRDFEIRDDHTGTMKQLLKKHEVLTVRKADPDMDQVFVEGAKLPLSYVALQRAVDPA